LDRSGAVTGPQLASADDYGAFALWVNTGVPNSCPVVRAFTWQNGWDAPVVLAPCAPSDGSVVVGSPRIAADSFGASTATWISRGPGGARVMASRLDSPPCCTDREPPGFPPIDVLIAVPAAVTIAFAAFAITKILRSRREARGRP
jgi:hypothetical protein